MRDSNDSRRAGRSRPARGWVLGAILGLAATLGVVFGQTSRSGGEGASKTALARYIPRQDLALYLEFDGLEPHADAWKHSAASKLLNDTKLGALLEDLARQGIELAQQSAPPEKQVKPA